MLRIWTIFVVSTLSLFVPGAVQAARPVGKIRHIDTATTLVRTDGSVVVFKPDAKTSAASTTLAADAPTAADVAPCLAQSVMVFCSMEDHKLATTDIGMGYHVHLDGVTPSYVLTWTNTTGEGSRSDSYEFDSRCSPGWYLDYNGPLGGDEICWGSGTMDVYWLYPHTAGDYSYRGVANNVLLATDTAKVLPGTLERVSGDGQSTLVSMFAQASLVVALRNYRGERVRFPIDWEYPERTNPFNFSITGPRNSTGAGFDPSIGGVKPGSDGTASIRVRAGDKAGTYSIAVTSADATPLAPPLTLNAVTRKEPDDKKDKEEGNGEEDCNGRVGDPINIGIGNSFQQETDYARTGISLMAFARSYNALGSRAGLMRNYWTTTFDLAVLPATADTPVRVRRPDGRVMPFLPKDGQYVPARPYFHGSLRASGSGWTFVTEDLVTETYDTQGRWRSITDSNGRTLTAVYNSKFLLTKVSANTGETISFTYNAYNQVATATDQAGRTWTYVYNGYANLIQVKEPDGVYRTYHYESPHSPYLLTGISVGRNAVPLATERHVTWEYDASGRAIANYFAAGLRRYDIAYDDATGVRIVTDPLQNQSTYKSRTLNGRGFVDGVVGPGYPLCGFADSELERDLNMNITQSTAFGRVTQYGNYDEKGEYGLVIEAAGTPSERHTEYAYDPRFSGKPTIIREPSVFAGHVKETHVDYDASGNVLSHGVSGFRPDGTPVARGVSYQYAGPFGQVSLIDGPRTDVPDITRFDYDPTTKRLSRVTDANGIVVRGNITYTATGQLASEDRSNGLHLAFSYYPGTDLLKSVTETSGAGSRTTTWTYDDRREVSSLTFSDGINSNLVTNFAYDAAGDLVGISSPGAGSIVYTLDKAGNRLRESYQLDGAEKRWIQRTFDAYGRLKDLIRSDGQSHHDFHPEGTLTSVIDARGNSTAYTYDDLKQLTRIVQPGQITTDFAYDVQDRLTGVTDANLATTRTLFDDLGNRIRLESPDTGVSIFEYDNAGNVVRSVDAMGQLTLYSYDAGNRLKATDRAGTADDESYAYDSCINGAGRLCSATLGIGDYVKYEYDGWGRISKLVTNAGTVGYRYDAGGNIVEITYPSQRKVRYAHDASGAVTGVTVLDGGSSYVIARNVQHLPYGPASAWSYGNGLAESRQYDAQYRPVSFDSGGRSAVAYAAYDGNGNPGQRTVNGDSQALGFDALDRLDTASGAFGTRDYDHDGVGNRTSLVSGSAVTGYAYQSQSNRLLSDSGWTYSRDANGNETRRIAVDGSGWDLTYTAHNRLLGVTDARNPNALLGGYRYNALGQRTAKTTPSGDTLFVYGLGGELLAELLPGNTVVQEYVYLDGAPIALLGVPASPAQPTVVDQAIDMDAHPSICTTTKSRYAINGDYQSCSLAYGFVLQWPWTPPVSGEYDVWAMWAWSSSPSQCYSFSGWRTCGGEGASAGTWLPLGRHHLTAGVAAPQLWSSDHFGSSVNLDALRYVLVQKDLTERDYSYVHTDALGTPVRLTDKTGAVVWSASYDPFGLATVDEDPDGNGIRQTLNLRFPGQYYDGETGLHYNYFRDYDPSSGRYLSSDPIGLLGGANSYAYVGGNPVSMVDPLGLRGLTQCEFNFLANYYPTDVLSRIDITTGVSNKPNIGAVIWNGTPSSHVNAQTYRYDIYVAKDVPNGIDPSSSATYGVGLLGHEIAHSMQFRDFGVAGFYGKYLTDWATNGQGYSGIPFEKAAFRMEDKIQNDLQKNGLGCGCNQ